jgi:hypothetical protein
MLPRIGDGRLRHERQRRLIHRGNAGLMMLQKDLKWGIDQDIN